MLGGGLDLGSGGEVHGTGPGEVSDGAWEGQE